MAANYFNLLKIHIIYKEWLNLLASSAVAEVNPESGNHPAQAGIGRGGPVGVFPENLSSGYFYLP